MAKLPYCVVPIAYCLSRNKQFAIRGLFFTLASLLLALALGLASAPDSLVLAAKPQATPTPLPVFCGGVYFGDTAAGVRQTDVYPCRPDWSETGPEIRYRLHTSASQALTLTLTHLPGIDLDLFLLPDGDMAHCLASDATLGLHDLPPGDHIIAIDGFAGSQGFYSLLVACNEQPFATPTPTDTPAFTPTPTPTLFPTPTSTATPTPYRPPFSYETHFPRQSLRYPPPTPQPQTIVLQPGRSGYDGLDDSYISAWEPAANYASADRLSLRQPDVMAPVLRFRLDGVPAKAHVVAARLGLWALTSSNDNPASAQLFVLNRGWNPGQVSWQQAAAGAPWQQAGANGVPQDRSGASQDQQQVVETGQWYTWDVTALIQAWLLDPSSNNGVVIKALAEPKVVYAFAAADYHNQEARPQLSISFWTPE